MDDFKIYANDEAQLHEALGIVKEFSNEESEWSSGVD